MTFYTEIIWRFFIALLAACCIYDRKVSALTKCQSLHANQTIFDVKFWEFFPYTKSNSSKTEGRGLFNVLTEQLNDATPLRFKWGKPEQYLQIFNLSRTFHFTGVPTNTILFPVTMETNNNGPCFVKVYESPGLAYVVRRNVKKPLTQLAGSFINGGQVIGLTLILTGIAGICMWLLDRKRNPTNFPPSFLHGSWQGFWWAFVTMTTVGYGDLAPKSVPARMFSVLWMLLGLVAFSVLTANFTSSLAREIETDLNLFNKKIAVFKGAIERQAVVDVGGKYLEYPNLWPEMSAALSRHDVEGILIDKHAVVSDSKIIHDEKIEIGKMIDFKYSWGAQLLMKEKNMCVAVKACIEDFMSAPTFKDNSLKVLSDSALLKDDDNSRGSLFEDYEFFLILIALFSVMTAVGVLWEYFYYNPRLLKKNQIESEEHEMKVDSVFKYIITSSEVQSLCENCSCQVETIYKKEGNERHERLKNSNLKDGIDALSAQVSDDNPTQSPTSFLPLKTPLSIKEKLSDAIKKSPEAV